MPVTNPFGLTKANDLSDAQIQSLWVDVSPSTSSDSLYRLARPASPMPTFILGGKGSGKTHLMRYLSYPIQKIRYAERGKQLLDGLAEDGYIGIYIRCSGLSASRFQGKGQREEAWSEVFSYYIELWLGQALLHVAVELSNVNALDEAAICADVRALFDANPPTAGNLSELLDDLQTRQRKLDFDVNNAAFSRTLSPSICLTRGKLVFGLPRVLSKHIGKIGNALFTYQLDEFENLSVRQQQHINTLVRERESPATFKVGARQFGVKTRRTFSGDEEENVKDSEYEELRLDQRFRENEKTYQDLSHRLLIRRLESAGLWRNAGDGGVAQLVRTFEQGDFSWDGDYFSELSGRVESLERAHFANLRHHLRSGLANGVIPGLASEGDIKKVTDPLVAPQYPLLEKANIMLLYGAWSKGQDVLTAALEIGAECQEFLNGNRSGRLHTKLGHFKSHLVSQLLRENGKGQTYGGLETFIRMSEGQPRALITLVKQTFDWATFQGEAPFEGGTISIPSQSKGALAASDWFYNSMMKAGEGGRDIILAIDRLAELFRINHLADNPKECSLIGFSARMTDANPEAARVLALASDRSFLVSILGGQKERNSDRVDTKLQLNRMLSPRWGLPTGRRGISAFSGRELNAVFDPSAVEQFNELANEWRDKMNAPFFGRKKGHRVDITSERFRPGQTDLFDE